MVGLRTPPLEVWLNWPRPNYIDPITKPKYVLVLSCILGPISIVMLLARLWVRLRIQRSAGWDDWLMLAAWVRTPFLNADLTDDTDEDVKFPMMGLTIIFPLGEFIILFCASCWSALWVNSRMPLMFGPLDDPN
jgi:hypothetical protein